jgi:hypothetical protein
MMSSLSTLSRRGALVRALTVSLILLVFGAAAEAATITIRSGNAPINQPDPLVHFLAEPTGQCGVGFAAAFTAADFTAADTGPSAYVITNFLPWVASLACDPQAQWITPFSDLTARSALFAQDFTVPEPCCIQHATLTFCWAQDDWLGDLDTFINQGVYLNGTALPISGGSYAAETSVVVDVTGVLHCGVNTLYVYNRDAGCAISGVIYSATFQIDECTVSTEPGSWGRGKSLYR